MCRLWFRCDANEFMIFACPKRIDHIYVLNICGQSFEYLEK